MLFPKLPELPNDLPWQKNAYLFLDGVSVSELIKRLYDWYETPEFYLLYQGTPLAELEDISPCLIRLRGQHDPGLSVFLEHANDEWGYLLFSDAPPAKLLEHLQGLLISRHPQDQPVYLRVADPVVMAALLTLDQDDQSSVLYGPVNVFVTADRLNSCWAVHGCPGKPLAPLKPPYQLSNAQLETLSGVSFRNAIIGLGEYLQHHFPSYLEHIAMEQRWARVKALAEQAYALGFAGEIETTDFASIFALLGDDALEQHRDIAKLVHESSPQTPAQRIEYAAQIANLRAQNILPALEQHKEVVL